MNPLVAPQLRVARPSRDLAAAARFYTRVLGLELLAEFENHAGFDGVVLGHPGWPYHLELTRRPDEPAQARPTDEDLLVFYVPDGVEWSALLQRMREHGARVVPSTNPYWDAHGLTIEDPDGYRIVIQHAAWP